MTSAGHNQRDRLPTEMASTGTREHDQPDDLPMTDSFHFQEHQRDWFSSSSWQHLLPAGLPIAVKQSRRFNPFPWQHGNRLWLLDASSTGWVLAELQFDSSCCCYAEVRRVHYRWAREAAGALMGRTLVAGAHEAEATAARLAGWLEQA